MNKRQQQCQSVDNRSHYDVRHVSSLHRWYQRHQPQSYHSKAHQYKACAALMLLLSGSLSLFGCATSPAATSTQISGGIGVPTTERTLAQRLLDESIEHTARVNIYAIDKTLRSNSRISIDSFYSEVLLTGEVPDASIKEEITKIVQSMPDVKYLYNRLNISRPKGSSYTLHDGYITSKLTAKIITNKKMHSSPLKVVTDDGVVYVLGRLTPSEQGRLIDIVNDTVGIKELVLLTTLVDDNGNILTQDEIMQESGLQPPTFDATRPTYPVINNSVVNPVANNSPVAGSSITNNPSTMTVDSDNNQNNNRNNGNSNLSDNPSPYIDLYKNQTSP
ncbi:BON domain-containing protein [Psychrobacter sp. I-STPA10]|uniref:BON domain-containing protein n=1 Tax=Psychrobacter sp. I-STPA10 TaxID=2585769 RepID=UPI001E5DD164|nr:BON domain-containing protein [Psychrobacter sp. I-STPA10]